jgi:endonuclease/exonuclease/phosphatase (EEP) superfamily protein YafD
MPPDEPALAVDPGARDRWPRRLTVAAIALCAVACAGAYLVALVPVWPCVLVEHFRVQLAAGGLIVAACAAAVRVPGYLDAAAVSTVLQLIAIAPDLCRTPAAIPAGGAALRVLVLNVHTESSSFDRVRRLIDDVRPDVIGLVEVDQRWLEALAPAVAGYPDRVEQPRGDNFGVALYARRPVGGAPLTGGIERLGGSLPSVVASVTVGDAPLGGDARLGIILVHPLPPISGAALAAQREQLDAVAARARRVAGPVLVMGDFNATPWSAPFRRLLARSGLCDSRAGFGVEPSFPADFAIVRIPIDHLLASCSIGVRDRRIERDVGSDHLPVVIDLVVPRS